MSRQSSVTRDLLGVSVKTIYTDDYGPVHRSRYLQWIVGSWEGDVALSGRWTLGGLRWRFSAQRVPFDGEDNEGMRDLYRREKVERARVE